MFRRAKFYFFSLLLLAFIIVSIGCGGGSNNNSSNSSPSPSAPPPSGSGGNSSSPGSGSGGSSGTALTTAQFAYVYNSEGNTHTITGFNVNASTGALTPMAGSPFSAPDQGTGLAATGGYLYASGGVPGQSQIASYQIGSTGALTPSGTTPMSVPIHYGLYAHSSGTFIYAVTNNGDIIGFQIRAPGRLSPFSGTPQSIHATGMALSPDGKWGFVSYVQTSGGGTHLNTYSINSSTGTWAGPGNSTPGVAGVPPQAGRNPTDVHLAVDPSSTCLFAANPFQNLVFAFRIGNDGSLTAVGNPNGTTTPGSWPFSLAATGTAAYFGDWNAAKLYGYTFTSGTLTPTPGSPYTNVGAPAYNMTVAPGGHLLYAVNNANGDVSVWNIAADGSLSQIPGSPFNTPEMVGSNPSYIVLQ